MSRILLFVVITLTWAQPGFTAGPGSGVLPGIFDLLLDPEPTSWLSNWICEPVSGTDVFIGSTVGIYFTPKLGAFPPTSGLFRAGYRCTDHPDAFTIEYSDTIAPYGGASMAPAAPNCLVGEVMDISVVVDQPPYIGSAGCSWPIIIGDPP